MWGTREFGIELGDVCLAGPDVESEGASEGGGLLVDFAQHFVWEGLGFFWHVFGLERVDDQDLLMKTQWSRSASGAWR